jgi:hypothetical protein
VCVNVATYKQKTGYVREDDYLIETSGTLAVD